MKFKYDQVENLVQKRTYGRFKYLPRNAIEICTFNDAIKYLNTVLNQKLIFIYTNHELES